jgi:hypothetical protein
VPTFPRDASRIGDEPEGAVAAFCDGGAGLCRSSGVVEPASLRDGCAIGDG